MARVYEAQDLRHRRRVAIKVLRPELSEAFGVERFLREIETAANLRHPHILPLFDSGEADGQLFYVMPLIEGETVRERVAREHQLALDDALKIAREVAGALHYAHARGVVHRDIKPENILLDGYSPAEGATNDWHAVVADFGIAHLARRLDAPGLTRTGSSLGTPRYMSPEQAAGEREVDGRADLYSLACTLFEMLAGHPPFTGGTFERMLFQHMVEPPPNITRVRPTVPSGVADAITRALAKKPEDRFATTAAFAEALRARGSDRIAATPRDVPSLAILPFRSLSTDPENEYFAEGITEDVNAQLSRIRSLKVVSQHSAMTFKKRELGLKEIAANLQVGAVLDGSVRRAGNRVRIVAQLIGVDANEQLWAETYDRELTDIFAIQSEVALRIAEALKATLSPEERARIGRRRTTDLHAYQLYLQGRGQVVRYDSEGFHRGLALFKEAVSRDDSFAKAYAAMAMVYTELGETGEMPPDEVFPLAKEAASRAIALDPDLAEAHCMLAYVSMVYEFDWAGAEAHFKRAIALDPNDANAYDLYGRLCSSLERHEEAIALQSRAQELDPIVNKTDVATAYLRAGRYDEAVDFAMRSVSVAPDDARSHFTLGWAYLGQGKRDEAFAEMEHAIKLSDSNNLWYAQLGQAYALSGLREKAEQILEELVARSRSGYVSPYHLAYVYTGLGRLDEAMNCLEQAAASRSGSIYGIKGSFLFKPLRSHPRFQALLRSLRLL